MCQGGRCPLWIPLPRATLFPFGYPMPTGLLLAPIGNPEPKGRQCPPLESSRIFYCCGYPNCQNAVRHPCSENTKTLQISSSNLMKPVAFYYSALISILREFVRYVAASTLQFSGAFPFPIQRCFYGCCHWTYGTESTILRKGSGRC